VSTPLLVQLSDPHIGARWADGDPVASRDASPGFAVHTLIDGALVSHVQLING